MTTSDRFETFEILNFSLVLQMSDFVILYSPETKVF
jgi:hypothetical protein